MIDVSQESDVRQIPFRHQFAEPPLLAACARDPQRGSRIVPLDFPKRPNHQFHVIELFQVPAPGPSSSTPPPTIWEQSSCATPTFPGPTSPSTAGPARTTSAPSAKTTTLPTNPSTAPATPSPRAKPASALTRSERQIRPRIGRSASSRPVSPSLRHFSLSLSV